MKRERDCLERSSLRSNSPPQIRSGRWPPSSAPTRRHRFAVPPFQSTAAGPPSEEPQMKTITLPDAVAMIPAGATLMIGGFMGVGTPEPLVDELVRQQKGDLTVIANDTAAPGIGIGKLVGAKLLRKAVVSHIGLNPETQQQMMAGALHVVLVPQGTLVERIRAGGCGLGGVLTPTGIGTMVEDGKRTIEVNGRPYLLETALRADF